MTKSFFVFFSISIFVFFNCSKLFSQSDTLETQNLIQNNNQPEFKNLTDLHIGYYGTTQNCKAFNVYALKYKRSWFLLADQENNITFLVAQPPRMAGKKVVPGSNFLLTGLSKANENGYTKLKKRRKVIKDIELYGYYKFHRPGRKAVKGMLYLEFPDTEMGPPWPFKWMAEKALEKAKGAESFIPEIKVEVPPIPAELPPPPPQ